MVFYQEVGKLFLLALIRLCTLKVIVVYVTFRQQKKGC